MAKAYLEELSQLMEQVGPARSKDAHLEVKHFFAGAAVYANGKICITLTPAGFALKLPAEHRDELLQGQGAEPLRYFPQGPIKKEYVVLPARMVGDSDLLRHWVARSVTYALKSSARRTTAR